MSKIRKAAAVLLAACTAIACSSCGENTATAVTADGYDVRAGIYLYYVTSAYTEAMNVLNEGGQDFSEATETKEIRDILDTANIDGITAEEWIQNKAIEHCTTFVAIEREFDSLGLSLTGSQLAEADAKTASAMNYFSEYYQQTGIGEESVRDIMINAYKQDAVWDAYYGEGGSKNIEELTLYDYYADNHLRIKYIEMPLKDGNGELLKSDGKKVIEEMANDYLKRLDKKKGSEPDLMKEFDFLIEEHNNYVTSLSEAAVTTTDEDGNQVTTETTAKVTTDKNGNTAATTEENETTETTTTTTKKKDKDKDKDTEETETTKAKDKDAEETETTETTTNTDKETETTTGGDTETTTTTTTTDKNAYDTSHERILLVSTAPKEDEKKTEETTTEPTYTPCEKVYNWLVDEKTDYLKPELIKDDECYYIAVKLDIHDRMVANDLWSSSQIENVRQELYYDEFLDMLADKGDALPLEKNDRAIKRYKVLDIDIMKYQTDLMNSYYSMYGNGS